MISRKFTSTFLCVLILSIFLSPVDASLAPSHVQVTCVSPTSAKIEWEPGNSSFSHEIIVNGTLHRTVRPGTFQHTLTNLEPDHAYKVYVRAANPKRALNYDDEVDVEVDSLTAGAEFRTEPGGGCHSTPTQPFLCKNK